MTKKNILYVPAWYPCSFFKEQASILENDYNIITLTGHIYPITFYKAIKTFYRNKFELVQHDDYYKLEIQYITNLRSFFITRQIDSITAGIGNLIISIFKGKIPDVIHIQSNSEFAYFVVLWAKKNNIRVVLTEHLLFIRHGFSRLSRLKEKVYEMVDEVMCVSNYLYRNLLTSGFKIKKASIIGNLIDESKIPNFQNVSKNGKILFVATHYHDKGLNTLLEVASLFECKKSNLYIDIIGLDDKSEYDAGVLLVDELQRRGLSHRINLKGKMSHSDLLQIYSKYSLLLSTSISETFGLAIAESIACGTKVVCTDSGGVRDFVNDTNGIIVSLNDIYMIVKAIETVFNNPNIEKEDVACIINEYGSRKFINNMLKSYS